MSPMPILAIESQGLGNRLDVHRVVEYLDCMYGGCYIKGAKNDEGLSNLVWGALCFLGV